MEVYAELANILFVNLFGDRLIELEEDSQLLGNFMQAWSEFEKKLRSLPQLSGSGPMVERDIPMFFTEEGLFSRTELAEIDHLRMVRNEVVHGDSNYKEIIRPDMVDRLQELTDKISESEQNQ